MKFDTSDDVEMSISAPHTAAMVG